MNPTAKLIISDTMSLQLLPRWITVQRDEDPETVAFLSGAALATLDAVLRDPNGTLPCALLRDRMALDSAVACLKLEGRNESGSDIRDAVCLARAGDQLGPAGEMFMGWRKLARINLGVSGWKGRVENALPTALAHEAVCILGSPSGTPVGQASDILAELLPRFPREEAGALMLADVALARAVGWDRPVPLLGAHMARRDIRAIATGAGEPRLFVHRAMVAACDTAIPVSYTHLTLPTTPYV